MITHKHNNYSKQMLAHKQHRQYEHVSRLNRTPPASKRVRTNVFVCRSAIDSHNNAIIMP